MGKLNLLYCTHCKKVIELLPGSHGCPTICCGERMVELVPNTKEAAVEKHIPVVTKENNKVRVTVGSVEHPMSDVHYIQFIYLVTNKNIYRRDLTPSSKPVASFVLDEGEKIEDCLAYCNLHGLWKNN